jgi:hypothetical protein
VNENERSQAYDLPGTKYIKMSSPDEGILVPAGVWCELKDFTSNTILLVLASHPYDPQGYEHNYDQYLKIKNPQ